MKVNVGILKCVVSRCIVRVNVGILKCSVKVYGEG